MRRSSLFLVWKCICFSESSTSFFLSLSQDHRKEKCNKITNRHQMIIIIIIVVVLIQTLGLSFSFLFLSFFFCSFAHLFFFQNALSRYSQWSHCRWHEKSASIIFDGAYFLSHFLISLGRRLTSFRFDYLHTIKHQHTHKSNSPKLTSFTQKKGSLSRRPCVFFKHNSRETKSILY